jgi:AraC-like DNA-binding protein
MDTEGKSGVTAADPPTLFRFSTDHWPERDRLAGLREVLGRKMSRLEFEPLTASFHADIKLRTVESVGLATLDHSLLRVSRTRELLSDGDHALVLAVSTGGGSASQFGREAKIEPGDAVLSSSADVGTFVCCSRDDRSLLISLSRQRLLPLVADFDSVFATRIHRTKAALQLLTRYVGIFEELPTLAPELQQAAVSHIYDLVAMAVGPTRDAGEIAKGRGMRAARLRAARAFVMSNLGRHDLSAAILALHLGVTPRYIYMLFEDEPASFSEFLLGERLLYAYRMLIDRRFVSRPISAVALDSGFNDLSYFNRTFRRRFGMTPSEARRPY